MPALSFREVDLKQRRRLPAFTRNRHNTYFCFRADQYSAAAGGEISPVNPIDPDNNNCRRSRLEAVCTIWLGT